LIGDLTGEKAVVVLSDDAGASGRIAAFAGSDQRWMVAVRMVSEGVDIPRLAVGVYATSASTPLYFAQAIGRFVRARKPGETASVFVPSVAHLLELASDMEVERDHVLGAQKPDDGLDDALLERAQRDEKASGELEKSFEALSATAELDQVIFDGASFGTPVLAGSSEEEEFLGLPGLLTADQVSVLLAKRQADQQAATRRTGGPERPVPEQRAPRTAGERRILLRKQLNTLVAAHHHRTNLPHGKIHAELRRLCGGPPSAQATIEQLEERIATIQTL
jgi:superfamily II DNA/RNA helicase